MSESRGRVRCVSRDLRRAQAGKNFSFAALSGSVPPG